MLFKILLPLFALTGSCSRLPQPKVPAVVRAPAPPSSLILRDVEANLEPRLESSEVFDIGFSLQNEELYAGSWEFAPPKPIPIPGTPVTVEPKSTIDFTLNCNDCRTYGEIVAELDTEGEGLTVGLTFNKAGAYLDFGISASNTLTATFALGQFLSTGNLTSKAFEAKIGLGLNLVLSFTAAIDLTGGFQLCIPDGAKLAFNVDIGLDGETGLTAAADVTSFPSVTFSLLPIEVSSTAVNITAALILKAEAAINTTIGAVSGVAAAGASLTIVEVNLGQTTTNQQGQCSRALFADIESNAGAFAKTDLSFDEDSIFEDPPNLNVSTVFATAGTTACVGTQIPTIPSLTPAKQSNVEQCAGGAATTSLTTVTKTNTLTSCLAPVVNCPNSLTQLVVITKEEAITTTFCPGGATIPTSLSTTPSPSLAARGEKHYTPYPTITTTVTTTTYPHTSSPHTNLPANGTISISVAPPAPACATGGISLSQLPELITAPLADFIQTIAPAEDAIITGSPELPATASGLPPVVTPPVEYVTAGAGRVGIGAGFGLVVGYLGALVMF